MSRVCGPAAGMALVLSLVLTACADGYPGTDKPLALDFGMDRVQALAAMNQIGDHRYLEHTWRYGLDEACRLRVESRGLSNRSVELQPPGPGWEALMQVEAATGLHTVTVRQSVDAAAPDAPGVSVITGASWSDASQIKWLMDYLPLLCRPTDRS